MFIVYKLSLHQLGDHPDIVGSFYKLRCSFNTLQFMSWLFLVFNATFNNISVISWFYWCRKLEDPEKPCRRSLKHFITYCCFVWVGVELTTLVAMDTDTIGSCTSNYHSIMTTTTPLPIKLSMVRNLTKSTIKESLDVLWN